MNSSRQSGVTCNHDSDSCDSSASGYSSDSDSNSGVEHEFKSLHVCMKLPSRRRRKPRLGKKKKPISDLANTSSESTTSEDEIKHMCSSEWNRFDLEEVNVFYAGSPSPLREILDKLKEHSRKKSIPVPDSDIAAVLEALLKQKLTFSVDLDLFENHLKTLRKDTQTTDKQWRVDDAFDDFCLVAKDLVQWLRSIAQLNLGDDCQDLNLDDVHERLASTNQEFLKWLLDIWRVRVLDFVTETKRMLKLYYEPPEEEIQSTRQFPSEEVFTALIKQYTGLYFLSPETALKTRKLKIRQKNVGSIPDVRYFTQGAHGCLKEELITLIQVKYAAMNKWSPDKQGLLERLNKEILEQIGCELIRARKFSLFGPAVLGIVIIRTEIFFVLLEMSVEHFDEFWDKGKCYDKHRSTIYYSDAFDIMKECDRDQLHEIFFWLGLQQHHNEYRFLDNFDVME